MNDYFDPNAPGLFNDYQSMYSNPQQPATPSQPPAPWGVAPVLPPPIEQNNGPQYTPPTNSPYVPAPVTGGYPNQPVPIPNGGAGLPDSSLTNVPLTRNNVPYPAIPPVQNSGSPVTAGWEAQQNYLKTAGNQIGAEKAAASLFPQQKAAQQGVLSAQSAQMTADSAYLNEQSRALNVKMSEQQAIQAAKTNTGDLQAKAAAQNENNVNNYRYQLAGLPAPIEVTMPPGYTGPMPAGTIARIQTLQQILTDKAADTDAMNQFYVEAARIKSANAGLAVTAAQIQKGQVALTVDEATNAAKLAGFDTADASLAKQAAQEPPSPGLVWDEYGQQWTDADTAALHKQQHQQGLAAQVAGEWGNVPLDTLISAYAADNSFMDDDTLQMAIQAHQGVTPTAVSFYMSLAKQRKENAQKTTSGLTPDQAAAIVKAFGGGGPTSSIAGTTTTNQGSSLEAHLSGNR